LPAPEDGGPPVVASTAPASPGEPAPAEAAPAPEPDTAAVTPPAEPVIDADPKRLANQDAAGLAKLLGRPAFTRTDGPATLLRYRSAACVLDAFLYAPRGKANAARIVDHVEARSPKGGAMDVRDCLAALLRARAKAGATRG
jgi:hypothetical protein